jgi:hypothetical protein
VAHLVSCPVDTKISSLHLWPTWLPIPWIPKSLQCICGPVGLLSCGYQDLFTAPVDHLASHPVDMKISSVYLWPTWLRILWVLGALTCVCNPFCLLCCG